MLDIVAQINAELKLAEDLKNELHSAFFREKKILPKFFAKLAFIILDTIENILSCKFYKKAAPNRVFNKIAPRTQNLLRGMLEKGFINSFEANNLLPDDPRAIIVSAKFGELIHKSDMGETQYPKKSGFSGSDFADLDKAFMQCLGESVERTCQGFYKEKDLISGSLIELKKRGAIDPEEFTRFSKFQLQEKKFEKCRIDQNSRFGWVRGKSLISGANILVPAQLIYITYKHRYTEPIIRLITTNGAVAHTDRSEAMYRGICEVIERDAMMIHWLNQLSPPMVDLRTIDDGEIQSAIKMFARYRLELYLLDMTTDIPIPTFATLLIDRSGAGPAVVLSNKTCLDSKNAVLGSMTEASKAWWVRRRRMRADADIGEIRKKEQRLHDHTERTLLWSQPDAIEKIQVFTKGKKKSFKKITAPLKSGECINSVLKYFKDNKLDVIAVETTIPEARSLGFSAYVILIPELQPLYLHEGFRLWGGERLYRVPVKLGYFKNPKTEKELNQSAHPYV